MGSNKHYFCSTGSDKKREMSLWDLRNMKERVYNTIRVGYSTGVLFPYFDEQSGLLFPLGKGDCII